MDIHSLTSRITVATTYINTGRKAFSIRGKEQEGRISYEMGISMAMLAFQHAQTIADPHAILFAEYTFIIQELQLCHVSDKDTKNSLTKAIQFFDDAFLVLGVVENKLHYQSVDKAIPHNKDYRVSGFPKDSFHIACGGHKTRLKNILRSPGIDPIEKALLKQRFSNILIAQTEYVEKQKKVLLEKNL